MARSLFRGSPTYEQTLPICNGKIKRKPLESPKMRTAKDFQLG